MEDFNAIIGNNIRDIRRSKGVSQEKMADELNITQSTYGKIESGKTVLGVNRLYFLANYFEVDLASFFPKPSKIENIYDLLNTEADNTLLRTIEQYINEKNIQIRELKAMIKE